MNEENIKLGRALAEIAKGLSKASKILQGTERKKKERTPDSPMTLKEFCVSCRKEKSPRSHNLLADWAELSKPPCETRDQWQSFFRRHIKDATELSKFSDKQIQEGYGKLEKAKISKTTMRTLIKYIV